MRNIQRLEKQAKSSYHNGKNCCNFCGAVEGKKDFSVRLPTPAKEHFTEFDPVSCQEDVTRLLKSHVLLQFSQKYEQSSKQSNKGMQAEEPSMKELEQWGITVCLPLHPPPPDSLLLWGCRQHCFDSCDPLQSSAFKNSDRSMKTTTFSSSLYFQPSLCPSPNHCMNNNS